MKSEVHCFSSRRWSNRPDLRAWNPHSCWKAGWVCETQCWHPSETINIGRRLSGLQVSLLTVNFICVLQIWELPLKGWHEMTKSTNSKQQHCVTGICRRKTKNIFVLREISHASLNWRDQSNIKYLLSAYFLKAENWAKSYEGLKSVYSLTVEIHFLPRVA